MTVSLRRARSISAHLELYALLSLATPPDIPGSVPVTHMPADEAVRGVEYFITYFICKGDTPIGLISLEYRTVNELYIDEVGVLPEFQGQHIGEVALKRALRSHLGMESIWLVTHPMNARALKLYERLGFEIVEWRNNYFGGKEPRYILELTDRTKI